MSQALYRKYRSLKLKDVLGQDHIVSILQRALEKGKIAHAYLLSGPRGTGKTSVARILAHEINGLPYSDETSHIDIIEIDAASNNGVDDIRNLRDKSRVAPVSAKYKIYIIDEVHMLSRSAFNALLKTLEEPPAHIVFIMATTDADKLPATILSRVQQFHFHPITSSIIAKHLIHIAKSEGFKLDKSAAELIAERGNGGFRDSISILDQLSSLVDQNNTLTSEIVISSLGLADSSQIGSLVSAYQQGDVASIVGLLDQLNKSGASIQTIVAQLLKSCRDQLTDKPELTLLMSQLVDVPSHSFAEIKLLSVLTSFAQPTLPAQQVKVPAPQPARVPAPKPVVAKSTDTPKQTVKKPEPEEIKEPVVDYKVTPKKPAAPSISIDKFSWSDFVESIRKESPTAYGFIAKCGYDITDSKIIIYSGTAFGKKKLEEAKNMQIIAGVISSTLGDMIDIDIVSGKKPPTDDKLAAVAAMMGGGEEVSLEETA